MKENFEHYDIHPEILSLSLILLISCIPVFFQSWSASLRSTFSTCHIVTLKLINSRTICNIC